MRVGAAITFDGSAQRTTRAVPAVAQLVEDVGLDSMWAPEHVVTFERYKPAFPYANDGVPPFSPREGKEECLTVLTAAAAVTSRIRLGTCVLILPQRNPVILAKQAISIDNLSAGRFTLGIGVGWAEEEFDAVSVPFDRRGARADEYILAMRALWAAAELATYEGEYVRFKEAVMLPKPVQTPGVPIMVGGQSKAALRRAATLGDAWLCGPVADEALGAAVREADAACEQHGRDPGTLDRLSMTYASGLDALRHAIDRARACGLDEVLCILGVAGDPRDLRAGVEEIGAAARTA
jgi:probable F420-dependent oxidoreductase